MITTVTQKNMIAVPAEVARHFGIQPGHRLEWLVVEGTDEMPSASFPSQSVVAPLVGGGKEVYASAQGRGRVGP